MLGGIGIEDKLRIVLGQLQQLVLHRQDAADDDGTLGLDNSTVLEHLGEPVVHALCYLLMLYGA